MSRYNHLRRDEAFRNLTRLSLKELDGLRLEHPGIPEEYLEFLRDVGAGTVGDASFAIYTGPVSPEDVYDTPAAAQLGSVVLFGDDFQGYCFGFAPERGWAIVEVSPTDHALDVVTESFAEFVREQLISQ